MGQLSFVRGTSVGPLSTDWSGAGAGRSATVRWRRMPGDSWAASVKAAWPVRTGDDFGAACDCSVKLKMSARAQRKAEAFRKRSRKLRFMGPLGWSSSTQRLPFEAAAETKAAGKHANNHLDAAGPDRGSASSENLTIADRLPSLSTFGVNCSKGKHHPCRKDSYQYLDSISGSPVLPEKRNDRIGTFK